MAIGVFVGRRALPACFLAMLGLSVALTGCASSASPSAYRAPPRQEPVLPDSLSPRECSSSTMGGGLLAVCDAKLLEEAWQSHTLTQRGTLDVEIAGRKVRVGGSPGLTQVAPDDGIGTLLVPAKVTLRGKASDGSYLYIRAFSNDPEHWASGEVLFRRLGLAVGGVATIDVRLEHGEVVFDYRRPDGSRLQPLRRSHLQGPGPRVQLPELPDHYADTPEQGARTYIAALNGHDGKTICQLWTPDQRASFGNENSPCWAIVSGLIGYGGESDSRLFQHAELLSVGHAYDRARYGVTFTAVPVTIRSHYLTSRYSGETETSKQEAIIWFRHTEDGWRIASGWYFARSADSSIPPDPYAEQHAAEARQREEAEQRAARRRTLVQPGSAPSCATNAFSLKDSVDADVRTHDSALGPRRLGAGSDIVTASVDFAGRRVCFSVTFAGRPLAGNERIALVLLHTPSAGLSQRSYVSFEIDKDYSMADGLHAGVIDPSRGSTFTMPAQVRLGVKGNTVSTSFTLPSSFPTIRRAQFSHLGWTVWTNARVQDGAYNVSDRAEAGLTQEKLAAQAAKAQREREARAKAAGWAPALVHFNTRRVSCRGRSVSATDTASDAQLRQPGTARQPTLAAMTDIRSATLAISGRHVCLTVVFAKQPFGRRQHRIALELGLGLTYRTKGPPYLTRTGFGVQCNTHLSNGLTYAGVGLGSSTTLKAANAVEVHGTTLRVDFDLEPSFPLLRPSQLRQLSWAIGFFATDLGSTPGPSGYLSYHDQLPNNPDPTGNSASPEIRQSDGTTIILN